MRSSIFLKLLMLFAVVIATATVTLNVAVLRTWEASARQAVERDLLQKTVSFAQRVNSDPDHTLQDIARQESEAAGARATIIDRSGKVLADSEADPAGMENHASRKEFVSALAGRTGSDERRSHTLGISFLYVAAPSASGAVRLAYPLSELQAQAQRLRHALLLSSALAFLVALLLAGAAAQYTTLRLREIVAFADRVAAGDLTARISASSNDEIGRVAAALDKTARRLEESFAAVQSGQRQLETLLNSMQDAVIAIGADGRVRWANRGMERLAPQGTRINAPVVETVRDPNFLLAVRSAAESQTVTSARAGSVVRGRTFDVTAAPMPGGGSVAVLRDLTETERIEKTRRDFIANVSHELRTPLTSIQGYAETLLDSGPETDHVREFLEIIRKNAVRMSRLTEDLLTLARVESGEQHFRAQPVAVSDLLKEAAVNFRELARSRGIELAVENTAEGMVSADPDAIQQVFSNLIDNAIKYAASGGRIVIGARPGEAEVEFFVRDFGPGIASEHLPRLFERFYRVDKARSRESGGTGLGLAIAKHIVLAQSGSIRAESELNHGSWFVFALPRA